MGADRYGALRAVIAAQGLDVGRLRHVTAPEASPFAGLIRHKNGHGLGLEVHEDPCNLRGDTMALAPGMVFTVEPGPYREGAVGVRIEDDLAMTEAGAETLTRFQRALRVVG